MSQRSRSTVFNVDPHNDTLTTTNVVVGRTSLSRFNWRIALALFLAGILWIGPYIGSIAVLLPAAVEQVAPDQKVRLVGVLGILGAALSLIANIVCGALSDLTRSRFGARTPWVLVGAIATAIGLYGLSTAQTPATLILWWGFYMLFLSSIIAPMVAVISDSVPVKYRGTVSAIYGVSLGGKFFLQAGMFSITNYQLYILTDYIGLDTGGAAGLIAVSATITLGASILFGFIAGPLSDKATAAKDLGLLNMAIRAARSSARSSPASWLRPPAAIRRRLSQRSSCSPWPRRRSFPSRRCADLSRPHCFTSSARPDRSSP
ncbi:MFS transporter [Cryobacterium sp.]|uniref:MFS transporter n=1 Tax=Cryobacterium sp. TaxID=1926290 RepID=UPI0026118988|nr:MFS transporter [Cryobacterium sp.]MCU1446771.1 transporter [Cryobacterium sp.]